MYAQVRLPTLQLSESPIYMLQCERWATYSKSPEAPSSLSSSIGLVWPFPLLHSTDFPSLWLLSRGEGLETLMCLKWGLSSEGGAKQCPSTSKIHAIDKPDMAIGGKSSPLCTWHAWQLIAPEKDSACRVNAGRTPRPTNKQVISRTSIEQCITSGRRGGLDMRGPSNSNGRTMLRAGRVQHRCRSWYSGRLLCSGWA